MSQKIDLDKVRADAVARIDRAERNYKLAFLAAAIVEFAFLTGFLLLSDLSNRTHLLLLISTMSGYSIVIFGLIGLASHINRGLLRLLKAIELLDR
jgi:hypothetical protein